MPAFPASLLEPHWARFAALLPEHPAIDPSHTLGCHRRVCDRLIFEHVVAALIRGWGYERLATPGCSERTIRRVHAWPAVGLMKHLHALVLAPG